MADTHEARQRAEALARRFHETYERLAPSFGYETRKASAVPWEQVPEQNRALMTAVCEAIALSLAAENAALREALTPFTTYDFHATQWISGLTHEGRELRALWAEDVEALVGHVERARVTLAAVPAEGDAALDTLKAAQETCPLCRHEWSRHDPADGCCDSVSRETILVCECGRDIAWMRAKTAALSRRALLAGSERRRRGLLGHE